MIMKKIFTLCAALFMGMAAFAQVDNTFQFVDVDGNEIADGSTWHAFEKTEDIFMGTLVNSGLYVKNTTGEDAFVSVDYQFLQMDGGAFQICYPGSCATKHFDELTIPSEILEGSRGNHLANETMSLQTEWIVKSSPLDFEHRYPEEIEGTCTVSIQLKRVAGLELDAEVLAYGPKITLVLHNDGTTQGIEGVDGAAAKTPVAYYSLDGRRLPVAQKGLNIVKYSDGTTAKVVVK